MRDIKNYSMVVWNHGSAGNPENPCGDICVFSVSGENIPINFIESITDKVNKQSQEDFIHCIGIIPTEIAVEVFITSLEYIDDGWYFKVTSFNEKK